MKKKKRMHRERIKRMQYKRLNKLLHVTLMEEIDSLITMLYEGENDIVTKLSQKIIDLLPVTPDTGKNPIRELLKCSLERKAEIPKNVFMKLLESGFDVNDDNNGEGTCMKIAVENQHYDAVRLLVQYGADFQSNARSWDHESAISILAGQENVPLDLFNLLATPKTLNGNRDLRSPLRNAAKYERYDNALHLIRLGADVIGQDFHSGFLLRSYIFENRNYNHGLFTLLIPSSEKGFIDCLYDIIAHIVWYGSRSWYNAKRQTLRCLIQYTRRAHITAITVGEDRYCKIALHGHDDSYGDYASVMYLFIITLLNVQGRYDLNQLVPDSGWLLDYNANQTVAARIIPDLWTTHKSTVMSLQDLCIQHTRSSMRDLSDESFSSLPVPRRLCSKLKLQDKADTVCAAFTYFFSKKLLEIPLEKLREMDIDLNGDLSELQ